MCKIFLNALDNLSSSVRTHCALFLHRINIVTKVSSAM